MTSFRVVVVVIFLCSAILISRIGCLPLNPFDQQLKWESALALENERNRSRGDSRAESNFPNDNEKLTIPVGETQGAGSKTCIKNLDLSTYALSINTPAVHSDENPRLNKLGSDKFAESNNSKSCKRSNNEKKQHKCPHCNAAFPSTGNLRRHIRKHTGEKPYKCPHCDAAFAKSYHLERHKLTHTGEKPHKCSICDAAFAQSYHLERHKLTHTGEKPHKCSICDAAFTDEGNLRRHIRKHTGEKPYKCPHCDAAFAQSNDLKRHIRTHTGEKPHTCPYCKAGFLRSSHLKRHIRTHTVEKPHTCPYCKAGFLRPSHLKRHISKHTGEKQYKCPDCDAAFAHTGNLERHIRTHTGGKPHKCRDCDAAFAQSNDLKRHIRTHTGEKPHTCPYCDDTFARANALKRHIRTHTGENPHKCSDCDAAFAQSSALRRHKLTHTGEKRYKCPHCKAAFARADHLNTHLQKHTREKCQTTGPRHEKPSAEPRNIGSHLESTNKDENIHKCIKSSDILETSTNLKEHLSTRPERKQFKCSVCVETYLRETYFKKHMTSHKTEQNTRKRPIGGGEETVPKKNKKLKLDPKLTVCDSDNDQFHDRRGNSGCGESPRVVTEDETGRGRSKSPCRNKTEYFDDIELMSVDCSVDDLYHMDLDPLYDDTDFTGP